MGRVRDGRSVSQEKLSVCWLFLTLKSSPYFSNTNINYTTTSQFPLGPIIAEKCATLGSSLFLKQETKLIEKTRVEHAQASPINSIHNTTYKSKSLEGSKDTRSNSENSLPKLNPFVIPEKRK